MSTDIKTHAHKTTNKSINQDKIQSMDEWSTHNQLHTHTRVHSMHPCMYVCMYVYIYAVYIYICIKYMIRVHIHIADIAIDIPRKLSEPVLNISNRTNISRHLLACSTPKNMKKHERRRTQRRVCQIAVGQPLKVTSENKNMGLEATQARRLPRSPGATKIAAKSHRQELDEKIRRTNKCSG